MVAEGVHNVRVEVPRRVPGEAAEVRVEAKVPYEARVEERLLEVEGPRRDRIAVRVEAERPLVHHGVSNAKSGRVELDARVREGGHLWFVARVGRKSVGAQYYREGFVVQNMLHVRSILFTSKLVQRFVYLRGSHTIVAYDWTTIVPNGLVNNTVVFPNKKRMKHGEGGLFVEPNVAALKVRVKISSGKLICYGLYFAVDDLQCWK
mmetsp:Transcript_8220/g.18760  ORF Transcript_8220/g.18760 Transcript_8220/m.18760 type:complete len:206 (+) Transcript_8220:1103-1720(+)